MSLSDLNFTFNYHNDIIIVYPLSFIKNFFNSTTKRESFFSKSYGEYFNQFSEYWQLVGKKSALLEILQRQRSLNVVGFSLKEVLAKFTKLEFPGKAVVVFYDLEQGQLGRILDKLPGTSIKTFLEDFVCIPCKTREEAKKIVRATSIMLGDAFAVQDGIEICSNAETGANGWENL